MIGGLNSGEYDSFYTNKGVTKCVRYLTEIIYESLILLSYQGRYEMKKRFVWSVLIVICIAAWGYAECNVTFTQPVAGSPLRLSTAKTIIWQQNSVCGSNILLKLVRNTGWSANIVSVPASNLSHNWTVGNYESGTADAGDGYQIKCVSADTGAQCGESGVFRILPPLVSPANPPVSISPSQFDIQKRQLPEIHVMQYERIDGGDVILMPGKIDIKYGAQTLELLQSGTGAISIPEDSPLINADGSVKTTVSYILKNMTAKNFRFNILLRFGGVMLASKEIIILSNQTKNVQMNINFPPTPQNEPARYLLLQGPVGTSDDTPISFFLASLRVRVFAL